MKISIMMRVRDEEDTLLLALKAASYLGDEVVVVLHCCTDNSLQIALDYQAREKVGKVIVKVFDRDQLKNECALSDLYNYALSFCSCDWVMKWDGDWYLPKEDCIEIREKVLATTDPHVDGFYTRNNIVFRDMKHSCGYGDEAGIFRRIPGRMYIANYSCAIYAGEELYHQNNMFFDAAFINGPIIFHLRTFNSEKFVKSRYMLTYYKERQDAPLFENWYSERIATTTIEAEEKKLLTKFSYFDFKFPAEIVKYFWDKFFKKEGSVEAINRAEAWEERAKIDPEVAISGVSNEAIFDLTGVVDAGNLLKTMVTFFGNHHFMGARILEHGCGIGRMTKRLIEFFQDEKYWVTDVSYTMLLKNTHILDEQKLRWGVPIDERAAGCFNLVFSFAVLMHISKADVPQVFKTFHWLLKPGGHVFFQLPVYLKGRDSETYNDVAVWTREEVECLARDNGFDALRVRACGTELTNKISGEHFEYHIFKKN